jgi:DNA-binding NtrC family response regulator
MNTLRVLVVEDGSDAPKSGSFDFRGGGAVPTTANANEALSLLAHEDFDVIYWGFPGPESLLPLMLKTIRGRSPGAEIVAKTMAAENDRVAGAPRLADFGFVHRRSSMPELLDYLKGLPSPAASGRRIYVVRDSNAVLLGEMLLGDSSPSRRLAKELEMAGSCEAICMLNGETGTGKDLAARYIHMSSARADKPFVVVNLPAIPKDLIESTLFGHERGAFTGAVNSQEGKFELADGGTIFLDEIGDLALEQQVKLLRVIENGEIERVGSNRRVKGDARIVAATSRRLDEMLDDGLFRHDLYYRLMIMPIQVPALRERRDDIPALSLFFLTRYGRKYHKEVIGFSADVYEVFARQPWLGNIRELSHIIERMVIYASSTKEILDIPDLPADFLASSAENERKVGIAGEIEEIEKRRIIKTLRNVNFNRSRAARELRLPVETLRYKMKKYGIKKNAPEPEKQ